MSGGLEGTVAINPEHSAHCVTTQSHDNHAVIMHLSQQDSLCSPPPSSSHRTLSRGHTPVRRGRPLVSALCSCCEAAHPLLWHAPGTQPGQPRPAISFLTLSHGHLGPQQGTAPCPPRGDQVPGPDLAGLPPGASDADPARLSRCRPAPSLSPCS